MYKLASSVALALGVQAGPRRGGCPKDYSPMANFDVDRYAGLWYEIVRDKYTPFELVQGCDLAEYTHNADDTVTVHNMGHRFFQGWSGAKAQAVVADTGDASLVVSFNGKAPDASHKPNYTVLDTDYETYSIVYSCGSAPFNLASWDFLWILSRTPKIDDDKMLELIGKIEHALPNYGFFDNHHMTRQEFRCDYDKRPSALE